MLRKDLLATLHRVEPGLSAKDLVPVFCCFCFGEEGVTTYDDVVAMHAPANGLGFEGAVRGKLLLGFLGACRGKDVELTAEGEGKELLIKSGRSKLRVPVLPKEDFLFSFPAKKEIHTSMALDADFLAALDRVSVSMGMDPTHPWRLGVTLAVLDHKGKTRAMLYTSDNKTAAAAVVPEVSLSSMSKGEGVWVLPPKFCTLLAGVGKEDPPKKLMLGKTWAEVRFTSGLRLFSRLVQGADPDNFATIFKEAGKATDKWLAGVPKGLDKALERAAAVTAFSEHPYTHLAVKEDKLHLTTKAPVGEVRDVITLESAHPQVEGWVIPQLVLRALPFGKEWSLVQGRYVFLRGKGCQHLVTIVLNPEGESPEEAAEARKAAGKKDNDEE